MTLRSPIFRKLLLSAFLLILVTLGGVDFLLTRYTAARELEHVEHDMETAARILASQLPVVKPPELAVWARQAQEESHSRVTIIDRAGVVLADSQHAPETMENHGQRPEVRRALAGQRGTAVRHSATLDVDFSYLALPAQCQGGGCAVLRLAVPLEQVRVSIAGVHSRILRASLLAALLALLVAYFFSRAFTRRIRKIQEFAEGLVNARFAETLAPEPDDELGSLARSLRGMAKQLRGMLDRLSQESRRREAILASMVEGVLAVDREMRVTFCNDSFARAVGARTPVGERLPLLHLVRDPSLLDLLKRVLATGQPTRKRVALAAADQRVFEVQAAPLDQGAIAILHDISELERLERVRKDFVANISHELRTPLATIRGYAETLLDGALDDQENNRKFLEIIRARSILLTNIASDLLVLAEQESGTAEPPTERISVREAIETAIGTVASEALVRDVRVAAREVEEVYIMGHRFGLEQALLNLLHNAIKFNRPGGEVLVQAGNAQGGGVRIAVSDTGIGIPSQDLPRIFERFYRVDKAHSRDVGGTGLGLSIVKHVVERMNGTIRVESRLGKGSTFTLLFPALPT
jgi:two-component system phosphate regulon sensor histidine kinase PhoR